jgi:hypothetical protein
MRSSAQVCSLHEWLSKNVPRFAVFILIFQNQRQLVVGISSRSFIHLDYKVEINDLLGIELNVIYIHTK